MIVQCEKCETRFRLDPERLPQTKLRVRCFRCQHTFEVELSGDCLADEGTPVLAGEPNAQAGPADEWQNVAAEDAFSFDDWAADLASELEPDASQPGGTDPVDPDPLETGPLAPGSAAGEDPEGPDSQPLRQETRPDASGPTPFSSDTQRLVPAFGGGFEVDLETEPEVSMEDLGPAPLEEADSWEQAESSLDLEESAREDPPDFEDPLGDLFDEPAPDDEESGEPVAAPPEPERPLAGSLEAEPPAELFEEPQEIEAPTLVWDYSGAGRPAQAEPEEAEAPPSQPLPCEQAPQPAIQVEPRAPELPAALARPLLGETRRATLLGRAAVLALSAVLVAAAMAPWRAPARTAEMAVDGWTARELRGRWIENTLAGPVFLVSGELVKTSAEAREPTRLRVALLDAEGRLLRGVSAPLGTPLARNRLRSEEPAALRSDQAANPWRAEALDAGAVLPFEALFIAVPPGAQRFVLEADG